jgi:hypothetical protein
VRFPDGEDWFGDEWIDLVDANLAVVRETRCTGEGNAWLAAAKNMVAGIAVVGFVRAMLHGGSTPVRDRESGDIAADYATSPFPMLSVLSCVFLSVGKPVAWSWAAAGRWDGKKFVGSWV